MEKLMIITEEQLRELGVANTDSYERVFDYISFDDIRNGFEQLGHVEPTQEQLEDYRSILIRKYESDEIRNMIEFLIHRGILSDKVEGDSNENN